MKYILPLFCLLIVMSCKKENGPIEFTDAQMQELLINKKWQVTHEYLRDSTGTVSQDLWPTEGAWLKDDYFMFKDVPVLYYYYDGPVLASGQIKPAHDTASWIVNNGQILRSGKPGTHYDPTKIITIHATNMRLEEPVSMGTAIYDLETIP